MIAEIISVGTELLLGQIVNTDAKFISERLQQLGIDVLHQSVVGDNFGRLNESLRLAKTRADIIITTGGLGPTEDDMTKECVFDFCGEKPILDAGSLKEIKDFFAKRSLEYTDNNDKQAMFPKEAVILKNSVGTAPGCILEKEGKIYIVLPGPPREMNPMFEEGVLPYLQGKSGAVLYTQNVQVYGFGEAQTESMIKHLIEGQTNPTIATYCHPGYVTIRITAKAQDMQNAKRLAEPMIKQVKDVFGNAVFEIGERELPRVVTEFLIEKGITISVSESCTGGLISDELVKVSGVSAIYKLGAVTYSNEAKMSMLGVSEESLKKHGAVSKEVALQMAEGVKRVGNTQIGVSSTGIAGPHSDDSKKPVGLVYIALATDSETVCEELHLKGDREHIRNMAVLSLFNMIRKYFMLRENENG
ncbi:MAG: competence/damage-inducible protein A [Clostridia bacterium]|nr:competence/damage-inducible protein A [Clostridia bacterium]